MTSKPEPPPPVPRKASDAPLRDRPDGPTQDELLDEALEETFPASDPTSVYRMENLRDALDSSNDYAEKNGLPVARHR